MGVKTRHHGTLKCFIDSAWVNTYELSDGEFLVGGNVFEFEREGLPPAPGLFPRLSDVELPRNEALWITPDLKRNSTMRSAGKSHNFWFGIYRTGFCIDHNCTFFHC